MFFVQLEIYDLEENEALDVYNYLNKLASKAKFNNCSVGVNQQGPSISEIIYRSKQTK
jgi:hypothetical protein